MILQLVVEIAILVAVVFESVISWKHYQLSRNQVQTISGLDESITGFDICDDCGFNLANNGRCLICEKKGYLGE